MAEEKKEVIFKPGDKVKFPGLKSQFPPVQIPPIEGELFLLDANTSVKGVMSIKGDKKRMMFLPDGTIYCHPKYGVMLTHKELTNAPITPPTENKG